MGFATTTRVWKSLLLVRDIAYKVDFTDRNYSVLGFDDHVAQYRLINKLINLRHFFVSKQKSRVNVRTPLKSVLGYPESRITQEIDFEECCVKPVKLTT
ncbi:hypothetical protein EGR_05770 [Echinococcus granulosus]|uniref:Uncharacterized protein n=1 Tax=Echinococcus granulosus TaxID=6210 RepID=W6UET3_ECHGR|nr:hypothetical protein EGR_05770 [Echinococcus granulosus]EUB59416.1 hypothetical protein EGR_05770 [Echinococcus granulosus]